MSTVKGIIYEKDSGQISMTVHAPDEATVLLQLTGREDTLEALLHQEASSRDNYIVNGVVVPRPAMDLSIPSGLHVGVGQELNVRNIPPGTRVIYPGGSIEVDDGFIDWFTDREGEYQFTFINFPFQEVVLNAVVG